jgi:hypothetical protein
VLTDLHQRCFYRMIAELDYNLAWSPGPQKTAQPNFRCRSKTVILSTHAIVGAGIASLMPNHPALAFASGIASHFVIDAVPHWDYPLRSISLKPGVRPAMMLDFSLFRDLGLITLDACVGLAVALWLYASSTATTAVLLGALGAMLPDPLQIAHKLYPREPLRSLQRFHVWIHTKQQLSWPIGVSSQLCFIVLVVASFAALRALSI